MNKPINIRYLIYAQDNDENVDLFEVTESGFFSYASESDMQFVGYDRREDSVYLIYDHPFIYPNENELDGVIGRFGGSVDSTINKEDCIRELKRTLQPFVDAHKRCSWSEGEVMVKVSDLRRAEKVMARYKNA